MTDTPDPRDTYAGAEIAMRALASEVANWYRWHYEALEMLAAAGGHRLTLMLTFGPGREPTVHFDLKTLVNVDAEPQGVTTSVSIGINDLDDEGSESSKRPSS